MTERSKYCGSGNLESIKRYRRFNGGDDASFDTLEATIVPFSFL
jgi:hypothetical protein